MRWVYVSSAVSINPFSSSSKCCLNLLTYPGIFFALEDLTWGLISSIGTSPLDSSKKFFFNGFLAKESVKPFPLSDTLFEFSFSPFEFISEFNTLAHLSNSFLSSIHIFISTFSTSPCTVTTSK